MPEQTIPAAQPPMPESTHSSSGPMIGIAIIVGLLAFGGYYFYTTQLPQPIETTPTPTTSEAAASSEAWQAPSGTSDDTAALQAELDATDMKAFDAEMNADISATQSDL